MAWRGAAWRGEARRGAKVLAIDDNPAAVEKTVGIIRSEGGAAEARVCDVKSSPAFEAAVEAGVARFGRSAVSLFQYNNGAQRCSARPADTGGVAEHARREQDHGFAQYDALGHHSAGYGPTDDLALPLMRCEHRRPPSWRNIPLAGTNGASRM